jgi:hypothetical protein
MIRAAALAVARRSRFMWRTMANTVLLVRSGRRRRSHYILPPVLQTALRPLAMSSPTVNSAHSASIRRHARLRWQHACPTDSRSHMTCIRTWVASLADPHATS